MPSHIKDSQPDEDEAPDMTESPTIRSAMVFFEELLRGCETPNIAVRFWMGLSGGLKRRTIEATLGLAASGFPEPHAPLARATGTGRSVHLRRHRRWPA